MAATPRVANSKNKARSEAAWPPARVSELIRLVVDEGLPYSDVGMIMGISKNMAIGKARRLGLISPNATGDKLSTTLSRLDAVDRFPKAGHCVWPIGTPGEAGFCFCGSPVPTVLIAYCQTHAAVAYQRARPSEGVMISTKAGKRGG